MPTATVADIWLNIHELTTVRTKDLDARAYDWIEKYCDLCHRCEKECPAQTILTTKSVNVDTVPGVNNMQTLIDREKCFEFFLNTMGCSVCVKVCPFSKSGDIYNQLKSIITDNVHT